MTRSIESGKTMGKKPSEMLGEKGDGAASGNSGENEIILNFLPGYLCDCEAFCERCVAESSENINRFGKRMPGAESDQSSLSDSGAGAVGTTGAAA